MLLVMGFTPGIGAEVFKCVDEEGNVQYVQRHSADQECSTVAVQRAGPNTGEQRDVAGSEGNDDATPPSAQETPPSLDDLASQYRKNCEAAKYNKTVYESAPRIRQADGRDVEMSAEERSRKLEEVNRQIDAYCNSPVAK